jgi:glycosyltransferase involved in cell wall biosynthesis
MTRPRLTHIVNVNSSIDPDTGGGTAERTFQMSRFLAKEGVQCTILTLDIGLTKGRINDVVPADVVALACIWKRFYVPKIGWSAIRRVVAQADIIHLMGHWSVLNAFVYLAARRAGKPYVVCPAGALPLFGRSGLVKRLYNFLIGKAIIKNASEWIAVTPAEFPQFEAYGIPASRVTVIPNGVNADDFPQPDLKISAVQDGFPKAPVILFMGRLNPIKGPDLLLQAFIQIGDRIPEYHLCFAGPDGGMLPELRELVAQNDLGKRVHFLGYIAGRHKSDVYHFARLLVVPSRQEAMSIVALEAGVCGTPVLMTDQCGFSDIRTVDGRLEVPADVNSIAQGMIALLCDPDSLTQIAVAWQEFVCRRYAWSAIAPRYLNLYSEILKRHVNK